VLANGEKGHVFDMEMHESNSEKRIDFVEMRKYQLKIYKKNI
jgi:hypothetical protein